MSLSEELAKLDELHQRGVLSDDEFSHAKARVLGDAQSVMSGRAVASANALRRSRDDRWIGGVCAGLARISGIAAWMWRLAFALLAVCAGTGVMVYLLLWLFVPEEDRATTAGRPALP